MHVLEFEFEKNARSIKVLRRETDVRSSVSQTFNHFCMDDATFVLKKQMLPCTYQQDLTRNCNADSFAFNLLIALFETVSQACQIACD